MKLRSLFVRSLRPPLFRSARARRRQPGFTTPHWLDELVAGAPDESLPDARQQAALRQQLWTRIAARTAPTAKVRPLWSVALRVAAALIPLLLAGAGLWLWLRPAAPLRYATGVGEQREVVLPDGSHAWLRPRSELRCAASFGATREIQLRGEAFFDVTKDPQHPFVVRTAAVAVRVLGTSFTVQAHPHLPTATVLVRTGRVQVSHAARVLGVLRPEDKLVFRRASGQASISHHQYPDTPGTQQRLAFEQASLREVLLTLENYYPVRFELRRDAPAAAITGTLDPSLSAEQITEVLNVLLERHHLRIRRHSATAYRVE